MAAWIWIPPTATARELVAVWVAEQERHGYLEKRSPTAIARALGLHRNTVRYLLRDLPQLKYQPRHWRPVRRDLLPARICVSAKVLATHIDRARGEYVPTLADYERDLGWNRDRVRYAVAVLRGSEILTERQVGRKGAVRIVKRTISPPASAQKRPRRVHNSPPGHRTISPPPSFKGTSPSIHVQAHPNETLTQLPAAVAAATGGWESLRDPELRRMLAPGPDVRSLFVVLRAAGIFAGSDPKAHAFACELATAGVRTGQAISAVLAAFDPSRSEGRVRAPAALARTLLERREFERRDEPLVGHELEQHELELALDRARAAETETAIAERLERLTQAFPLKEPRAAEDLERQLIVQLIGHELERDLRRELAWIVHDRRGGLLELAEFACRCPLEGAPELFPEPVRSAILAERTRARDA